MERHLFNTHVQCTYSIHITLDSGACNAHYLFEGLSDVCFYLFIFWLCGVFLAGQSFSSCSEWGLLFTVVRGLLVAVASLVVEPRLQAHGLQQLQDASSVVLAPGLQMLCGMWNLLGPGIELLPSALSGILLSAILPRKSATVFLRDYQKISRKKKHKPMNKNPLD